MARVTRVRYEEGLSPQWWAKARAKELVLSNLQRARLLRAMTLLAEPGRSVQRWLRRDLGGRLPSDVFREHSLACYVTDPISLKLRHEIGIDIIAWECDYPHSDSFWPDAPELVLAELAAAGADDADIDKITWQNACRFFRWDPFATAPRDQATVGALRARATDVDTAIRSRSEWAELYTARHSAA